MPDKKDKKDIEFDKQEDLTVANKGVNDTPTIKVDDADYLKYIDSLSGLPKDRCYPPISFNYRYLKENKDSKEVYDHREVFNKYHLRIGDCCFVIPPESFSINDISNTIRVPGIRKMSSLKKKSAYSYKDIAFTLFFNGDNQINGFPVDSPFNGIPYYVDGLRPFLAQCKLSPIMPVENDLLNNILGIYAIAIQSINVSTVPGFPKLLKVDVSAVECNTSIYTQAPNFEFTNHIEWDLYKYNYQRLMCETNILDIGSPIPKECIMQPVKNFSENQTLELQILNDDFVKYNKENKDIYLSMNNMSYDTLVDNKNNSFIVNNISFGYSNILTQIQLSNHTKPAIQYIGGNDTTINIQITTQEEETALVFSTIEERLKGLTMSLRESSGTGFLKIKNPFINMIGTNYLLVDDIKLDTVPNFPGLYSISISCLSYDTTSLTTEEIKGLSPFKGDKKGTKADCISQDTLGLLNKIRQDLVVEEKICDSANLYPDLLLPRYNELDKAIKFINEYRNKICLEPLPYKKFPRSEIVNEKHTLEVKGNYYADPDYYFVYPYQRFEESEIKLDGIVTGKDFKNETVDHTYQSKIPDEKRIKDAQSSGSASGTTSTLNVSSGNQATSCDALKINVKGQAKIFLDTMLSQVGNGYLLGSYGQVMSDEMISRVADPNATINRKWMGKVCFDCSGLVAFALKKAGMWEGSPRVYHLQIVNKFKSVGKEPTLPGDIVYNGHHIAAYLGGGKIVEAAKSEVGIRISDYKYGRFTGVVRPNWSEDTTTQEQPSSTNESTNGNITLGKFGNPKYDKYDDIIMKKCQQYGLDPNWIKAMIMQESTFQANQVTSSYGPDGPCDATGLLQVSQPPCKELHETFSIEKLKNPETNLDIGCRYIKKYCLDEFGGDYLKGIPAYNCGPGRYHQFLRGRELPPETTEYIEKISKYREQLLHGGGKGGSFLGGLLSGIGTSLAVALNLTTLLGMYTQTIKVQKKHGFREVKFSGTFGTSELVVSPLNGLIADEIKVEKDTIATDDRSAEQEAIKKTHGAHARLEQFKRTANMTTAEEHKVRKKKVKTLEEEHKGVEEGNFKDFVKLVKNTLEEDNNTYLNTMTVDDTKYNKRGTMLKAFPTYCLVISSDDSSWFDSRKLWNNYYPYKSVTSISVFHEKEQPVGTAKISVTNLSHNLTRYPNIKEHKNIAEDKEYGAFNHWFYKNFGFVLGTAKVTDEVIDAKNHLLKEMKLEPGARVHIRMGYGSNPDSLNTVFNGTVAEVTVGEELQIVAQSDGAELVNNVVSAKKDSGNGLFKIGAEASNMAAALLTDRCSLKNILNKNWGENSDYHIEHFGLYLGNHLSESKEYDLCKNVYMGKFDKELFCQSGDKNPIDNEKNIYMFLYNKTPWDILQTAVNCLPEFVCQPVYHQFETRLFMGLPTWGYKYRYDLEKDGTVLEKQKTFQQVHIVNEEDILDNKLKTTSKFLHTNVVPMYSLGGDMRAAPTLFSDKSIHWGKQKTMVVDTILQQDFFGWDGLYEWLGLTKAKENAICLGVSTLINEYNKMYYDDVITLGKPGIKPCDYIFIQDGYSELYGLANVRSVIHTFSPESGFISTIQPGCIAYSKTHDSGSGNVYRTCLNLCDIVSTVLAHRRSSVNMVNSIAPALSKSTALKDKENIEKIREDIINLKATTDENWSKEVAAIIKKSSSEKYVTVEQKELIVKLALRNPITFFLNPGLPFMSLICRTPILSDIIDFFKYSNCIGLRPLIRKYGPFVSGTKGSEKLIDGFNGTPNDTDTESENASNNN